MENTFISKAEIQADLKVSDVTIWRWCRDGHFPKPVRVGPSNNSRNLWILAEYSAWKARILEGRVAA